MLLAYNNLLESLPINRKSTYYVSKRSELKKVYNNIVNQSKKSPFYMIDLSRENQEYAIGVKEAALSLKAKIEEINDPLTSCFNNKAIAVSNEDVLTAELINDYTDKLPEEMEIEVSSLAEVQENRGKDLFLPTKGLSIGEYNFIAKVGENSYPLSFVLNERVSNEELLNRMANLLNESVPGITAAVEGGSFKDYKNLRIIGDKVGRYGDQRFRFEDSGTNNTNIVDYFGMNHIDKAASFACFNLNGVERWTPTNTFTLENTLRINLKGSSDEPVTLKLVPVKKKVFHTVESLLESYNDLIKLAQSRRLNSEDHYKAYKLLGEMNSLVDGYQEELTACGIVKQEDGTLSLDDALSTQAVEDGGMMSLLTRENGFITRLLGKAETIAINPIEYLDNIVVTYPNVEKEQFRSSYVTSMYSGLFFNSYC